MSRHRLMLVAGLLLPGSGFAEPPSPGVAAFLRAPAGWTVEKPADCVRYDASMGLPLVRQCVLKLRGPAKADVTVNENDPKSPMAGLPLGCNAGDDCAPSGGGGSKSRHIVVGGVTVWLAFSPGESGGRGYASAAASVGKRYAVDLSLPGQPDEARTEALVRALDWAALVKDAGL